MKLQISKNSILKCAILTVVTFLCSVEMSVGATYKLTPSFTDWNLITENDDVVVGENANQTINLPQNIKCRSLSIPTKDGIVLNCQGHDIEVTQYVFLDGKSAKLTNVGTLSCGGDLTTGDRDGISIQGNNINVGGAFYLKGQNAKIDANVTCKSVTVSDKTGVYIKGSVRATEDITLGGNGSFIEGPVSCEGSIYFNKENSYIKGNVVTLGLVKFNGKNSHIIGDVDCQGELQVGSYGSYVSGNVNAKGKITLNGQNSYINGAVSCKNAVVLSASNYSCIKGNVDATGDVTISGQKSYIEGNVGSDGNITLSASDYGYIKGNVDAQGDVLLSGQKSYIDGTVECDRNLTLSANETYINGDADVKGNITLSGQKSKVTGTATVNGNITMSASYTTINTVKAKSMNFTIQGYGNNNSNELPIISTLILCTEATYTKNNYLSITKELRQSCGAKIEGNPVITSTSETDCASGSDHPTLSLGESVSVTDPLDGFPLYDWYLVGSPDVLKATTNTKEWTIPGPGTYYCIVRGDLDVRKKSSSKTINTPTGVNFSAGTSDLAFEKNLCPGSANPTKTFTFTRKSGCDNADAADVNSIVSITGSDASKFSKEVRKTSTGTYEVTVSCVSTEAGTFDDASLVISESGETVSIDLSAVVTKPQLTIDPANIVIQNQDGASAGNSKSVSVTISNACSSDINAVSSNSSKFTISKDDSHENTWIVTYTTVDYDENHNSDNGTITFSSTGADPIDLNVVGIVSLCSEQNVANFDFDSKGLGSTDGGITITTGLHDPGNQPSQEGYHVGSGNGNIWFQNGGPISGTTGNCFQISFNASKQKESVLSFSANSDVDVNSYYAIQFLMGNASGNNGDDGAIYGKVYVNGSNDYDALKFKKNTTVSRAVSGADLLNGVAIQVTAENAKQVDNNYKFYLDDIVVSKVCPPKVDFMSISGCDVNSEVVAMAVPGSATIKQYDWYIDDVLVATHVSSSETDTYTQAEEIGNGKTVKVVVTDEYGITASADEEINCGPVIGNINAPNKICPNTTLLIDNPSSITPAEGIIDQGWEISQDPNAPNDKWAKITSLDNIPELLDDQYIRYFAENATGRGKSNSVQISMYKGPQVGNISVADVCEGNSFELNQPINISDTTIVTELWQYSEQSDFSTMTEISNGETLTEEVGTYYIRYVVTDACGLEDYSEPQVAKVVNPHIEVSYATNIYYRTKTSSYPVTEVPILSHPCVDGPFTYEITAGNDAGYFSIDANTGEISLTSAVVDATEGVPYTIKVTAKNNTNTIMSTPVSLDIVISSEPELTLDCSTTEYYMYSKYIKLNIDKLVTSANVNDDVTFLLTGVGKDYFSLSSESVPGNSSQHIVISNPNDFAGEGTYNLKLWATTRGEGELSQECDVTIYVRDLSISSEKNDQTICGGNAESLFVSVTGEDHTNLPLTYQWYNGTNVVPGATSNTFVPTEDGDYYCKVFVGTNEIYTSETSNIFFIKNMPVLEFDETVAPIPSMIYCTQEVGAAVKVTLNGSDVTSDYTRYWWQKGNQSDGLTSTGEHTYKFDCSSSDYTIPVSVYIMENTSNCVIKISKNITVKKMAKAYYYCGPTGENSDVTNPNNWWTNSNGTGNHPAVGTAHVDSNGDGTPDTDVANAFYEDASKFIIDKDDVILKSGEIWNVTGVGSTITISSGFYDKATLPSAGEGWSTSNNQYDYKSGQYFQLASSSMNGKNQVERMTSIASSDYRNYAKVVTIAGTLNTYGNAKVDVDHGGSLTIASDKGDFEFGTLQNDEITHYDGNSNGYYNVCVNPGSSVTYTGDGTKNIRNGIYSQLYIEPTNSTDDIIFEKSAKVDIVQSFTLGTNANFEKINANGSSVYYVGTVHQDIASMPYYVLDVENSNNKTLTGRIDVEKSMTIGAGSKLVAGSNTINLNGKGTEALVFEGLFDCGTSTVNYNSTDETTIAAMDYYNLNLGNGNRTFATDNNVGIAGTFTPSSNSGITYTIDNSTIEFNGTEAQAIPAFTFYDMIINNTAMSGNSIGSSFDNTRFVRMNGNVTIENKLLMTNGILDVNSNHLVVENTSADAIGQGYLNDYKNASFVVGNITRSVPSSLTGTDMATLYYFPIGDVNGYKPLTVSQITTSSGDATITTGISTAVSGTFVDGENSNPFSSPFSWYVGGTNFTSASFGISTSQGLGDANAIAYNTENSGEFSNVYGSMMGNSILYSQVKEPGYFALAKRTIVNKKYYYNCSGTTDASQIGAWFTEENGQGTVATSFNETDAEWIINCGTTINAPLAIYGANSKVTMNIPFEQELIINSVTSFITGSIKQGVVNVTNNGELDVMYSFTMNDVSSGSGGVNKNNRSWIKNSGAVNIYNSTLVLTDSWITNNKGALFNLVNTDMKITSGSNQAVSSLLQNFDSGECWMKQQPHSCFWNYGNVTMTNGNLDVTDDGGAWVAHVTNANGANWLIDNTNASGVKHVTFDGCELSHDGEGIAFVDMQCGSTFAVKNSDVQILYKGQGTSADIGGEVIVEDGNLYIARSDGATGGTFNLEQKCGTMYLIDTDGNGDGLLELKGAGGGYEVNIEGTVYAQGVVESGGNGASLNIKKDGTMFIGDLGATIPAYTWNFHIDVEEGGTLYYCGNRTSGADGVGSNEGDLYYAGSYYETRNPMEQQNSNPAGEGDFSGGGKYEPIFVGEKECMEAYVEGLPDTRKGTLLPIELTLLYGVCNENGDVVIRWQTASETNNGYFTILRSFDGVHFEELDIVWGAGTTTEFHNYEYVDTEDNTGIVYYKLRQTDYDGNTTESKVIAVQTCGPNAQFRITEDQIDIFFNHPEESSFVVITSITGQIFYSKSFRNTEAARIAVPQRKGIYIISVIDSKTITSEKFIR